MIIFTSICNNYLHKARCLAESVKKNIPDATFVVCLTESEKNALSDYEYFDRVILAKDAFDGSFEHFIFKHAIVEASTSVKGAFFQYLYKIYPEESKFVYLDPDIYVYSDFTELRKLLDTKPIVVCPHLLKQGNVQMEISSMAHGVYNLGFLAVNASDEAKRFIDWWAARLDKYCYDDISHGIFTDQKWIDLAPCFFDVYILKHHGYDYATWSIMDSVVEQTDEGYTVNGDPLRFIHFSGYGEGIEYCIRTWLPEGEHLFKTLYSKYCVLHEANDSDGVSKTKWSYSDFYSGESIENKTRIVYRENIDLFEDIPNPFEKSNTFIKFRASKQRGPICLLRKVGDVIKQEGFSSLVQKVKRTLKR